MNIADLPAVNATLNTISASLLLAGYIAIRSGRRELHQKLMLGALLASAAFLACYLVYHAQVGSVKYPLHDWTRGLYFLILLPHILLAALMTPFVVVLVWLAWRQQFTRHRRLGRWLWPVWMFVSVSGVVVYLMLYQWAGAVP